MFHALQEPYSDAISARKKVACGVGTAGVEGACSGSCWHSFTGTVYTGWLKLQL